MNDVDVSIATIQSTIRKKKRIERFGTPKLNVLTLEKCEDKCKIYLI
jgi:hypothetical protein